MVVLVMVVEEESEGDRALTSPRVDPIRRDPKIGPLARHREAQEGGEASRRDDGE